MSNTNPPPTVWLAVTVPVSLNRVNVVVGVKLRSWRCPPTLMFRNLSASSSVCPCAAASVPSTSAPIIAMMLVVFFIDLLSCGRVRRVRATRKTRIS
jgi:hypothetical protein